MQSVQDFFADTGPNSYLTLNTAEKEEAMHFITRLVSPGIRKEMKLIRLGKGLEWAKCTGSLEENEQEAKASTADNTGRGSVMGRALSRFIEEIKPVKNYGIDSRRTTGY